MKISTGTPEDHPTPLPVDASATPGVAGVTPVDPGGAAGRPASTLPGRDTTGEWQAQQAQGTAAAAAAMTSGMAADGARRDHYGRDLGSHGSAYGDAMNLPLVPDNALPPASSFLYPNSGDEPTEAGGGFEYVGNEPMPG